MVQVGAIVAVRVSGNLKTRRVSGVSGDIVHLAQVIKIDGETRYWLSVDELLSWVTKVDGTTCYWLHWISA